MSQIDNNQSRSPAETSELPSTSAFFEERNKLRDELRPEYDHLVKYYRFFATVHHKRPFVSYKVLADLIREGWRFSPKAPSR